MHVCAEWWGHVVALSRASCAHVAFVQTVLDPVRLRQVLTNGLSNAMKYGRACSGSPVVVRVRCTAADGGEDDRQWLLFEILDGGPGLQGLTEETLFSDFAVAATAIDPARLGARSIGSSGLGLPIIARLARCVSLRQASNLRACVGTVVPD